MITVTNVKLHPKLEADADADTVWYGVYASNREFPHYDCRIEFDDGRVLQNGYCNCGNDCGGMWCLLPEVGQSFSTENSAIIYLYGLEREYEYHTRIWDGSGFYYFRDESLDGYRVHDFLPEYAWYDSVEELSSDIEKVIVDLAPDASSPDAVCFSSADKLPRLRGEYTMDQVQDMIRHYHNGIVHESDIDSLSEDISSLDEETGLYRVVDFYSHKRWIESLVNCGWNGATFRATREYIGYTQEALAERFSVNVRTVKRWESNISYIPIDVANQLMSEYISRQNELPNIIEQLESHGYITSLDNLKLPYYRSQEQYDLAREDGASFGAVNARNRAFAYELQRRGLVVSWVYPEEGNLFTMTLRRPDEEGNLETATFDPHTLTFDVRQRRRFNPLVVFRPDETE